MLRVSPLAAEAQQAAKISRIGYLATNRTPHFQDAFRQGLRDLGYVEGRNLVIEDRNAEGKPERLPLERQARALETTLPAAPKRSSPTPLETQTASFRRSELAPLKRTRSSPGSLARL